MPIGQDAEGPTSLCFSPTVGCQIRDTGVGLRFAADSFNLLNDDQKIPGGSFCSVGTTFDASREATGDTDWAFIVGDIAQCNEGRQYVRSASESILFKEDCRL
ncbi:hypothetical protein MesoLjLc_70550 [Mesorhizobium sp. L-8-10]|nr:hypothetical protein MesoLjLb_69580 [Mesorhizobium sp. L-8-3]BCH35125.1 hypothetical protein MesoLjLc_70550 [Mesorhizobium sp. L-8-10]